MVLMPNVVRSDDWITGMTLCVPGFSGQCYFTLVLLNTAKVMSMRLM